MYWISQVLMPCDLLREPDQQIDVGVNANFGESADLTEMEPATAVMVRAAPAGVIAGKQAR